MEPWTLFCERRYAFLGGGRTLSTTVWPGAQSACAPCLSAGTFGTVSRKELGRRSSRHLQHKQQAARTAAKQPAMLPALGRLPEPLSSRTFCFGSLFLTAFLSSALPSPVFLSPQSSPLPSTQPSNLPSIQIYYTIPTSRWWFYLHLRQYPHPPRLPHHLLSPPTSFYYCPCHFVDLVGVNLLLQPSH